MPYENEESSLIASSNFNKNLLNEKQFHSHFQFNNKHKSRILTALQYLWDSNKISRKLNVEKNNIYNHLQCIDGSLVNNTDNNGAQYINMQFGSAFLDIKKLFSIQTDNKGNVNPYHVAQLFGSENNILLGTQFPSKNVYFNNNGQILTLKDSFIESLNHLFDQNSNPIVSSFLDDLNILTSSSNLKKLHEIDSIKKLLNDIREDSIIYTTEKEVQKLMLISETMLSQYLLKHNSQKQDLIILDGRLHNQDIGDYIKEINPNRINQNSMLVGVQKTGILNIILSEIHNILKDVCNSNSSLKPLFDLYHDGKGIFLILTNEFKIICGLPDYKIGNYGTECFYITEAPKRQEFVFTLPEHLFKTPDDANQKKLIAEMTKDAILKITSVFEYAHTDLYLGNKGVLLANVLAHSHVSLNKQFTNILSNSLVNNIDDNNIKTKLKI